MSGTSDISRLFEMAGGSPSQYQEVEGTEREQGARARWTKPVGALPNDLPTWLEESTQRDVGSASRADDVAVVARAPVVVSPPRARDREPSFVSVAPPVTPAAEPVIEKQPRPAPLSSVFARLLKQGGSDADDRQHRAL